MFGMGFMEIMIIAVIAVIFLGPDKLPEAMINIAKFFRSMKTTVADAKNTLEQEMSISELKQEALSYKEELMSASHELDRVTSLANLDDTFDDVKDTIQSIGETTPVKKQSPYAEADKAVNTSAVIPEQPDTDSETITFEKKPKAVDKTNLSGETEKMEKQPDEDNN